MSRKKEALKHFYEEVGAKYPEEEIVYGTLRGRLRKEFVRSYLKDWQGSLLDVGCNQGMYLYHYQDNRRIGIDLSLNVLRRARKDPSLHYMVADAEQLQCIKPRSFDNVLCSEVLEHCIHPEAVFEGIHHVLKSSGKALITTPNYRRNRPEWIDIGTLSHFGIENPVREGYLHTAFRAEELVKMAEEAGFSILESGTLEKEVKYAAKIPVLFLIMGNWLNRILRWDWMAQMNEKCFNRLSLWIYFFCHATRLEKAILPFIREGVRSYILVKK
ncbi:class I SAM-dependent methyltransferase [bacterium]